MQAAEKKLIRYVQRKTFGEVTKILLDQGPGKSKAEDKRTMRKSGLFGSIYKLSPWMDEGELLRVGGRLENARIEYDEKH